MKRMLSFLMAVAMVVSILPLPALAAEGCANHPAHDASCGYVEAVEGQPCNHQHSEACRVETVNCTHVHTAECYPDGAMDGEPSLCEHVCSEESGCVTVSCNHVHDGECGYVEAVEGKPCNHSCELCNPPEEPEEAAVCICDTRCNEMVNTDCPVCNADPSGCRGKDPEEPDSEPETVLVTAWAWVDPEEYLEDGGLALPGASAGNPASVETVVAMLPAAIMAVTAEGEISLPLTWACPGYPAGGAYEGEYTFTAALPEGYALAEGKLTIPVTLGGGQTFDIVSGNGWEFDTTTGALTVTSNEGTSNWYANGVDDSSIKSVTLTDTVTEIREEAFFECRSLESVTFQGSGVRSIGLKAFMNCSNLSSIVIPEGVTSIGRQAFASCSNLSSVTIPTTVSDIGLWAFGSCTALKKIYYNGTRQEWHDLTYYSNAFQDASISSPQWPWKVCTVTLDENSYIYNGAARTPVPTVVADGVTLVEDTDYTVAYTNNIDAGTATVTVTGKGSYSGTETASFTIKRADLATAVYSTPHATYANLENSLSGLTVTIDGNPLKLFYNYFYYVNPRDIPDGTIPVGTHTLEVYANGSNCYGSATVTFIVDPAVITAESITLSDAFLVDGVVIPPEVSITIPNRTLTPDIDYTVTHVEGERKITVEGKGNYVGTVVKEFETFTAVARIGDKYFRTYWGAQDALNNHRVTGPVVLLKDTSEGGQVRVLSETELDLNGHVLSANLYSIIGGNLTIHTEHGGYVNGSITGRSMLTVTGPGLDTGVSREWAGWIAGGTFNKFANLRESSHIDGGTFHGTVTLQDWETYIQDGVFHGAVHNNGSISGGKFYGTVYCSASKGKGTITGGYFQNIDTTGGGGLAEGFVLVGSDDAEFKYMVVPASNAAAEVVGGMKYATLQAAVDACPVGGTVKLLKMVAEKMTVEKKITVELNNFGLYPLAESKISDGTFKGYVENNGSIEGGVFEGEVFNISDIRGGTFSGPVTNGGNIYGGQFNNTAGMEVLDCDVFNIGTVYGGNFKGVVSCGQYGTVKGGHFIEDITVIDGAPTPGIATGYEQAEPTVEGYAFRVAHAAHTGIWTLNEAGDTLSLKCSESSCTENLSAKLTPPADLTYNGQPKEAQPVTTGHWGDVALPTITYPDGNTNAGTVTASVTLGGKTASITYTVGKAVPTYTAPAAMFSLVYNGAEQALVTEGLTDGGTIYYKLGDGAWTMAVPTVKDAGSYTVYWKLDGGENYDSVAGTAIDVTVDKKPLTLAASVADKVYDGTTAASGTFTLFGAVGTDNPTATVVFTFLDADAGVDKPIRLTMTLDDDWNKNYAVRMTAPVTGNITPKPVDNPTVEVSGGPYTYDGTAKEPTVTVKDGNTVIPSTEYTVGYEDNTNAGTAAVTVTDQVGGNYTVSGSGAFAIARKSATVTAENKAKVFGQVDPALTYVTDGVLESDKSKLTVTLVRATGEDAGSYTIFGGASDSTENYEITFVEGTLTITPASMAEAVLTLSPNTFTYDRTEKKPAVTVALGDVELVEDTDYILSYSDNVNAGKATVTVTGKGNFSGTAEAEFTIEKALPTVNLPTLAPVTYGVKLSEIKLPAGWSWADESIVPTVKNQGFLAYFAADEVNYDWTDVEGYDAENHRVSRTLALTVNKADPKPEIPTGLTAATGQTLADVKLPAGWKWNVPGTAVEETGEQKFPAAFTPVDTDNYNILTVDLTVTVGEHLVKFDSKGGSSVPTQTVKDGEKAVKPTDPTREGYAFKGWYKDEDLKDAWKFEADKVTETMTLYAKWAKVYTYTLSYDTNAGKATVTKMPEAETKESEDSTISFRVPFTKPKRSGYTFTGWNTQANGNGTKVKAGETIKLNGDLTLYAQWKKADTTNAKTGDYIMIAVGVLAVSGAALAGLLVYSKKKKK